MGLTGLRVQKCGIGRSGFRDLRLGFGGRYDMPELKQGRKGQRIVLLIIQASTLNVPDVESNSMFMQSSSV